MRIDEDKKIFTSFSRVYGIEEKNAIELLEAEALYVLQDMRGAQRTLYLQNLKDTKKGGRMLAKSQALQ